MSKYLNDVFLNVSQVATAEHRIGAIGRVIANASLIGVDLLVDDGHFQAGGFVSEGHVKDDGLESGHEVDEDKYSAPKK
jgi:hypothetical protein